MNAWGFWAAVVQSIASIAWPAALVSAVWILRDDIRRLLPYAQIKVGANELSFGKNIQAALDQARLSEVTNEAHLPEKDLGATRSLTSLSDDVLREKVIECVKDLRAMAFKFNSERNISLTTNSRADFEQYTRELLSQSERQRHEFQSTLFPIARALYEELLKRTNGKGAAAQRDQMYDFVFEHGSLAGPDPLGEAAARLEQLARNLG